MGCATSMVKYLLFFFNFIFVAGGAALIAFGVLQYNGYKTYENVAELGPYQAPPIIMMVVGGVMFCIAFMGCCGAVRESKCMMMTYATLLSILLLVEVAIAVGIYKYQDDLKDLLKQGLEQSQREYLNSKPEAIEFWDTMQNNLKCCGVESYKEWHKVPQSCCATKENCQDIISRITTQLSSIFNVDGQIFTEGCLDKVFMELKTEQGMYAAAILAAVELIGVVFACCLGARFGRKLYHT